MSVAGLVLAAGGGSRIGRPKALLRLGDQLLVERAAAALRDGGCVPVCVVLGAAADEVRAIARLPETVVNPDWESGMGSSLRAGLAALAGRCDAVVVSLVDTPFVGSAAVRRVVDSGATLATATYGDRRGHPVLLGREWWPEVIAAAQGDVGARPVLAAHADRLTLVECGDIADPYDIDTLADLAGLAAADHQCRP